MRLRSVGRHASATPTQPAQPAQPDQPAQPAENDVRPDRRRRALTAALIAIIVAAVSALAASAAAPSDHARPAAQQRPAYLQPVGTLIYHGYLPFPALLGDTGKVGVPSGTEPAPAEPDPAVMAQQAPLIAQFQGANGTLTPAGIATLALAHGCDPTAAVTATAIAMAESGGSPSAQGDIGLMTDVWDWSAGLWQIRGLRAERGTGGLRDSIANQDADTNAVAMYAISGGCTDWTPWSTYNTGAYQQFLPISAQAVRYVVAYYRAHGEHYPPVGAPDPTASIPVQGSGATTTASGTATTPTSKPKPKPQQSSSPKPGRISSTGQAAATPKASSSAPAPAPSSTAQQTPSEPRLSVSVPKLTLTSSVPLPKPSLTLPLPSPSLSVPSLPGLP